MNLKYWGIWEIMRSEKIRICFVINTDIRTGAGVERTLYYYLKYIDRNIFAPIIVMTDDMDKQRFNFDSKVFESVPIVNIKSYIARFNFVRSVPLIGNLIFFSLQYPVTFLSAYSIKNILKGSIKKIDILYLSYSQFIIYFPSNIPLKIGSEQTLVVDTGGGLVSRMQRLTHILAFKKIDVFHFLSLKIAKCSYLSKPIFIIPSGIDRERFNLILDSKSRFVQFVFFGRLVKGKGVRTLLSAWEIVMAEGNDNFQLNIIGGGDLEGLVMATSVKNVKYYGVLSDDDLVKLAGSCDVFVYPSTNDTFSLTTVEAMAMGLYVITTDYFRGIFDEARDAGFLEYLSKDAQKYAERMIDVASNIHNIRMKREAIHSFALQKYSWDIIVEELSNKFIELYDKKIGS